MMTRIAAISMPTWGLTMEEGKLVKWLVPEGIRVAPGMEIAEIETSKATNVLEVQEAGVLRRQVITAGETRSCGDLIGILAEDAVPDSEIEDFLACFVMTEAQAVAVQKPEPGKLDLPDGRWLRYLRSGEGNTPAVLIHGFGGDLDDWQMTQPDLAADRAVYAIDLPGHGESAKEMRAGDLAELAESVVQAMNVLGLAQAHLVGHSLGGGVALQLALTDPGRVASLTLIAPACLTEEIDRTFLTDFVAAQKTRDMQKCLGMLFADPAMASRKLAESVIRNKRMDGAKAALANILAACFRDDRQQSALLPKFVVWVADNPTIPVAVIWGEQDAIVSHHSLGQLPATVAEHLLPNIGHMPQFEAVQEVNTILVSHLRGAQ